MLRTMRKYISLLLVAALLITSVPFAMAEEQPEYLSQQSINNFSHSDPACEQQADDMLYAEEGARILYEETSLRTENTKYFRLDNGNMIAAKYAYPVHIYSSGEWTDINNSISLDGPSLTASQGDYQVSFAAATGSEELVSYGNDDNGIITMNMDGIPSNIHPLVETSDDAVNNEQMSVQEYNEDIMTLENLVSTVKYNNVSPQTDLEYIVTPGMLSVPFHLHIQTAVIFQK